MKITGQLEGNQYNVSNIYSIALENTPQSASGVVIEIHFQNASSQWQSLVYGSQRTLIEKTKDGINSDRFMNKSIPLLNLEEQIRLSR